MSTEIVLEHLIKKYDENTIIPDLSLRIKGEEFFTLLGPSGCGKTTLLRMIAGFNSIEGGEIRFNRTVINNVPAHKRNIGMVFQNYAIFPHMTVQENVMYGLKMRNLSRDEMQRRTGEIMDTVRISEHKDKLPEKLSGGQQQRVALARAIVVQPDVLLMDEPLSNLDAKLRVEMRSVIRELQKKVGITTVYVTHDQEEALAVSDRIAIFNHGVVQQVGTPQSIYQRPYNEFVATFIGISNMFDATLEWNGGGAFLRLPCGFTVKMNTLDPQAPAGPVRVAVRPEEFSIVPDVTGMRGTVRESTFLGRCIDYTVELADGSHAEITDDTHSASKFYRPGDSVCLVPDAGRINVFDASGGHALIKGVKSYVE